MDEKKILDHIRRSADDIEVPDSLHPDQVKERLEFVEPKKGKSSSLYRLGGLAAALLITFAALWQADRLGVFSPKNSQNSSSAADSSETERQTPSSHQEQETEGLDGAAQGLKPSSDYDTIYEILKENFSSEEAYEVSEDLGIESASPASEETADAAFGAESATSEDTDFSRTNIREEGVDEGDTVRTDGTYLYLFSPSGKLRIVKADGGDMELACTLTLPNLEEQAEEMYLDGDTLILITSSSSTDIAILEDASDAYDPQTRSFVHMYTYDISDRSNPILEGTIKQEGIYRTSRKQGDVVYLFTEYFPAIEETQKASTFIPEINDTPLSASDILLPEYLNDSSYLVLSSVDTGEPSGTLEQKAIVSAASLFYVSAHNIYICNGYWNKEQEGTQIIRFGYTDGSILAAGAAQVPGSINDSFSLDEYEGNLRILTTDWSQGTTVNNLFILDKDLNMIGKLTDLAPEESIRSARYMGDIAYFVTFRDTDPLFSVDVSDPSNPVLLGALKIPGFSSYLHFYGENLLLGLGYEVDSETGEYQGVKLSMFDISDPSNVTETSKYVLLDTSYCPGLYDYKAILADPDKNILGFQCEDSYLVFCYDAEQGFLNLFTEEGDSSQEIWYSFRGLFISDTFYLTDFQSVQAYDMTDQYRKTGSLDF